MLGLRNTGRTIIDLSRSPRTNYFGAYKLSIPIQCDGQESMQFAYKRILECIGRSQKQHKDCRTCESNICNQQRRQCRLHVSLILATLHTYHHAFWVVFPRKCLFMFPPLNNCWKLPVTCTLCTFSADTTCNRPSSHWADQPGKVRILNRIESS